MSALLLLALALPAAAQERWDARLSSFSGEVRVHPAGGGEPVEAAEDAPLEDGDKIVTGRGASAEISLDGGGLIALGEGSELTIESSAKDGSVLSLALGSLIAKLEALGERRSLEVRTPAAVAAVRGTEFGVDTAADGCHVAVFDEGEVEVRGHAGEPVRLKPGLETTALMGAAPGAPWALRRFAKRRAIMLRHRERLRALRARWRAMPPERRRELRGRMMQRRAAIRERVQERRRDVRERVEERRRERRERRHERR